MANYLDLYAEDPAATEAQAKALAEAMMRRRAAGTVATILGGPFAGAGRAFLGDAAATQNDLNQAGMVGGQQRLRREGMLVDARQNQERMAAEASRHADMMGLKREELGLLRGQKNAKDAEGKKEKTSKDAEDLRNEFQKLGTFKSTQDMADAIAKIRSAPDTGSGDLSLIYSYVKILDPGSVVREGEIKLSREPTPLLSQLVTSYKKATEGRLLHPDIRKEYKQAAEALWGAQAGRYNELATPYRRMARERGLPEGDVVLDYGFNPPAPQAAAVPSPSLSPKDAEAKAWAEANPTDPRAAAILKKLGGGR